MVTGKSCSLTEQRNGVPKNKALKLVYPVQRNPYKRVGLVVFQQWAKGSREPASIVSAVFIAYPTYPNNN